MQFIFNEDSNLYGYADGDQEFEFPSNIKQMGCLDDDIKIYMEDYVYTYLYQYAKSGGNKEKLAALVGRHIVVDNKEVIIISGAIQGKNTIQEKGVETFTNETWDYINTQLSVYFNGLSLLGWVHTQPGFGAFLMSRDEIFHRQFFKNDWQVLYVIDPLDKMDTFFVHNNEKTGLKSAKGYFIYYEKNEGMQEYMLNNSLAKPKTQPIAPKNFGDVDSMNAAVAPREENRKPLPEERIDAAKKIRKVLKNRAEEAEAQTKKRYSILTGISGILCIACLFMGISLMGNIDRIKKLENEVVTVQTSYKDIVQLMNTSKTASVFAAQNETQKTEQPPAETVEQTLTQPQEPVQETAVKQPEQPKEVQPQVQTEEPKEEVKKESKEEPKKETAEVSPEIYIVEEGDNLGYISTKFYGTKSMVDIIMDANGIEDPDKIYMGKKLIIPRP